jgi:hypothetical protein
MFINKFYCFLLDFICRTGAPYVIIIRIYFNIYGTGGRNRGTTRARDYIPQISVVMFGLRINAPRLSHMTTCIYTRALFPPLMLLHNFILHTIQYDSLVSLYK